MSNEHEICPLPLEPSTALPLVVKSRKSLASISSSNTFRDEGAALEFFDKYIDGFETTEAAFLTLMQKYKIKMNILQSIGAKRLTYSFNKVTWKSIAPLFGLDPDDPTLSEIGEFKAERSWLPLEVIKNICEDVEQAEIQYGKMIQHNNEEARNRYTSMLFGRVISLFKRKIINRPEELIQGEITERGRVEHQFLAFGTLIVLFIEVKKLLLEGAKRVDQIAQILAEADACDYRNSDRSLWAPVLGVLCDGYAFEFFVYDSSTRKLSLSPRMQGLEQFPKSSGDFRLSIKRSAEYLYDIFLVGYINGLRAFLEKSSNKASKTGKRDSTEQWHSALGYAEMALRLARQASGVAACGNGRQAEEIAVRAVRLLDMSIDAAPPRPKKVESFMTTWTDDQMLTF